ncbi:MAG TPA: hypothetical protein VMR52_04225 [Dehalococcoidia bacterium]|nr:hypothetical protein [Dehalococcoidia bacterium]
MKGFLFPVLAGLACLPCVLPVLIILAGGIGVFLTAGLLVSGVVVLLGGLVVIALLSRSHPTCVTPRPERDELKT